MAPAQATPIVSPQGSEIVPSDNLPNPLADKQAALREQAIQQVLAGDAQVQTINGSKVVDMSAGLGKGRTRGGKDSYQSKYVKVANEGTDRIFVVLVQFGDQASPYPPDPAAQRTEGPLRNQIPEPDRSKDNSTVWRSDYSQSYFQDLYFGNNDESLKGYMETQSSGRYSVDGTVTDWVKVPYTEGRYGTDACGSTVCSTVKLLIRDAAKQWVDDQLAAGRTMADVKAELATFDVQDRYDLDGDGNFNEPDGWIDHFQIVHAGGDEADGDPIYGTDAIWSHRWYSNLAYGPSCYDGRACNTGTPIGGTINGDGSVTATDDYTGFYVGDYTIQPENGGRSVFDHEYTHDLGLPDDYNVNYSVDNNNEHWTLMAQSRLGSATDQGIGERAGDLGAWNKLQLGWLDYSYVPAGQKKTLTLGASEYNSKDPQALIVGLPEKAVQHSMDPPYEGNGQYYSGYRPNAITTLTRTVTVPAGNPTLTFQGKWDIETGYDYVQVLANGAQLAVWDGTQATWLQKSVDLSAYAGQTITLSFAYVTDPAVGGNVESVPDGIVLDDIRLGGVVIGDAENGLGDWTTNATDGFIVAGSQYTTYHPGYYIAANRTYVSHDRYLQTGPYFFGYGAALPDKVDHYAYQQGLLISYWDTSYQDNDTVTHPGAGRNLYVDAHPQPFAQTSTGNLWRARVQIYDAPFGLAPTDKVTLHVDGVANTFGGLPGNPVFNDRDKYFFDELPNQGVKLPGVGVSIAVKTQNGTKMTVKVS
ncbi:immune inhibitor A domain-containing protein [Xylanimonas sp. McL0601]|uniref:immune inhibitor A domain-containing protein n=1 Tax=Xylanimonas sp. McL0601 TaxID=3414739 RepID=UPI003CE7216A